MHDITIGNDIIFSLDNFSYVYESISIYMWVCSIFLWHSYSYFKKDYASLVIANLNIFRLMT